MHKDPENGKMHEEHHRENIQKKIIGGRKQKKVAILVDIAANLRQDPLLINSHNKLSIGSNNRDMHQQRGK